MTGEPKIGPLSRTGQPGTAEPLSRWNALNEFVATGSPDGPVPVRDAGQALAEQMVHGQVQAGELDVERDSDALNRLEVARIVELHAEGRIQRNQHARQARKGPRE